MLRSVPTLFNLPRLGGVARAIEIRVRGPRKAVGRCRSSKSNGAARAVPPANGSTRRHGPPRCNLLAVPVAEQETFIRKSLQKTLKGNVKKSLAALKEEQKAIDDQIHQLIQADARLKESFDLMMSVLGVGPVIATELLLATNEMQAINDPKKLACHAGVAPFDGGARALPIRQ